MRDYGKVHTSFWASPNIRALSEDGRTLAMYLLTCPHGTIAGAFRLPDGYACEDLQWSSERVREGFAELLRNGFANRCETTKWVWVAKHLDWNPPENPNQRKSAAKVASQIPEECIWRIDFLRVYGESLGLPHSAEDNRSTTVTKPFANQEQEQEQEQEQKKEGDANASLVLGEADDQCDRTPDCPHDEIISAYHELLPMCPAVRVWTDKRRQMLRTRWREDAKRQSLDWWRKFFGYVARSAFLTGRVQGKDKPPFLADLEWLVNATNIAKVIEGKYHREEAA